MTRSIFVIERLLWRCCFQLSHAVIILSQLLFHTLVYRYYTQRDNNVKCNISHRAHERAAPSDVYKHQTRTSCSRVSRRARTYTPQTIVELYRVLTRDSGFGQACEDRACMRALTEGVERTYWFFFYFNFEVGLWLWFSKDKNVDAKLAECRRWNIAVSIIGHIWIIYIFI